MEDVIEKLLRPSTVAIVGASRDPSKIGHQVLRNLLEGGFPRERIFPINPYATQILGLKCYPTVKDVPVSLDLAVIVVPARVVPRILQECAEKGVKAVAIITSGFKEVGNVELENELVRIARRGGFRILGPNIVGVCDTIVNMNASFCEGLPLKGDIAFITQSGALGIAIIGWTRLKNIGLSDVISIGNKADINEIDLMEFLGDDPHTKVITAYLEGIEDGRRFMDSISKVVSKKPVIILKAGKAERTIKAIKSHTGSLAGSDLAYEIAFKQTGVIRAPTFIELFDWAVALSKSPLPKGDNVVILTNGGGAGVLATDAMEQYGLTMMDIPPDLFGKIRRYMPPFGSVLNPIDLTGMAGKEWYKGALIELLKDERVSSVIVIYCHTAITNPREIGDAVIEAIRETATDKPVIVSLIGGDESLEECERLINQGVPCYESPEKAVSALGAIYEYKRARERALKKTYPVLKVDKKAVEAIIKRALEEGRAALTPSESIAVAESYGIPVLEKPLARTPGEAVNMAEKLGYPVVLEVESPQVIHKTDVGGIRLNLRNKEEVQRAYKEILESVRSRLPDAEIKGIIVRRMAKKGREVIIGMHRDPTFGPLVMFGSGGTLVELVKDVSFRVAPLSLEDAEEIIRETRAYNIVKGFRGEPEGDIDAIKDAIIRVSRLSEDFEEISDIDINPFFVYEKGRGGLAIDVKIILRRPPESLGS